MRDHHTTHDTDHIVAAVPLTAPTRHSPTTATAPPLPTVPEHHRTHRAVYALARIDASGRIADHTTTDALCWHPGDPLFLAAYPDQACVLIGTQNWLDTLLAGLRPRARTEEDSP
jgi:hypothetical protein